LPLARLRGHRTLDAIREIASGELDLSRSLPRDFVSCSEVKQCGHEACVSFGKREPCWSRVGSMQPPKDWIQCPGVLSGKVRDCAECEVFKAAERDEHDTLKIWFNVLAERSQSAANEIPGLSSRSVSVTGRPAS